MKKLSIALFTFFIYTFAVAQENNDTTNILWKEGYLDIHHINTGRGVCTFFILPDGTTMMVDAGDMDDTYYAGPDSRSWPLTVTPPYPDSSKNSGEWIVDYMKQVYPQVKQIDYALITHFHTDHMGVIRPDSKTALQGGYKLTGITQVGDLVPIKKLIDRSAPNYNFPLDLNKYYTEENSIFLNYQKFIAENKTKGLKAEGLSVGNSDQLVLMKNTKKYPNFRITGVKSSGTIWTGVGNQTQEYILADSIVKKGKFNENPLSLAIKLSYGKFDYFTGGDNTGLQGYGLPKWFDTETPMAKAVGKVEVTTLDHHGNRDGTNENFLSYLQPQVVVEQTWCSDHPGQEVMHRLLSDHIYKGEKNIFATNIQEVTKHTLGYWFTKGYKSMFGHVIVRVLPGGNSFYVLIAETVSGKIQIKKSFGPYNSN
ncbi:beta-lactamase superfamily II metal-dependent hydrolase [Flavobacterium sp. 90]|uniref:ComEC/Rec2 family competence protein n=1 Tax=unclassified Flavobacterium TaxID=196869 RepID=UPI000EAE0F16|nr:MULTISPECIES: MBL fold metallo-hydrolase [unclassified Flavobacterium]RKR05043.1 beta-lactamase superfamily II metal-dependent hydrolase [Flavobacterium sp. 81]TCK56359.1 beta-lactamase superfamily II metal-dependent hydrolase [Flavobacterium sp. 90]